MLTAGFSYKFVHEDMLRFLRGQQQNSSNITINGIDDVIINPSKGTNTRYIELLAKEATRVAGKDNFVFGVNSRGVFEKIVELGFTQDGSCNFLTVLRAKS